MKKFLMIFVMFVSAPAFAGGWSGWAKPYEIDTVRDDGIMVYGNFGNPNTCTTANKIFVPRSSTEYDKIYATVLAAFSAQKELRFYSLKCDPVGWYTGPETTYNWFVNGAVNIRN